MSSLFHSNFFENFHFVRPWWLLAFFALFLTLFLIKKYRYLQSPWQHFIPAHLSRVLLENSGNSPSGQRVIDKNPSLISVLLKPFTIGFCAILALAGPAWQKLPQPVYQLERGSVLIMDMSYSMYATDVKPNRLTRARYKAVDLLKEINEGEMGLIAYTGDAYIISPLTLDIKNIELLLPSLSPEIMPSLGANALAALTLAHETLTGAGHLSGDIYWFTDDVDHDEMADIYNWTNTFGHRLNILGVGTSAGAPIKLPSGALLKEDSGSIVVPKLPERRLSALASSGNGNYSTLSFDDSDIITLTNTRDSTSADELNHSTKEKQALHQGDQFQEQGPWLLLIILPLILSYFRRGGALLCAPLMLPFALPLVISISTVYSKPSVAAQNINEHQQAKTEPSNAMSSVWQNMWKTPDQQGQKKFDQKDYTGAAKQFENSQWQGSSHYKAGNYQQALNAFKQSDSSTSLYNQGNALAKMQQYDQALKSYKKALEKNPQLTDAKENIKKIEDLLKKQQKNQQQQGDQSEKKDDQAQQDKQSEQQNEQQQQGEQSEQQNDQAQQDKQSEQQNKPQQQDKQSNEEKQTKALDKATEDKEAEKTPAQIAAENKAQETQQKHQQMLNKVTDDPYLLLRNKMRLEYQKRKQDGTSRQGVNKKW